MNTRKKSTGNPTEKQSSGAWIVYDPDSARQILRSLEKKNFSNITKFLCVAAVWCFGNSLLRLLQRALFRSPRYCPSDVSDVLVYTVGIVGDNVVLLPALAGIREAYPKARLTVVSNCQIWSPAGASGVLGPLPWIDRLIVIKDHPLQRLGFRLECGSRELAGLTADFFVNLSPFGNRGCLGPTVRELLWAKRLGAKWAVGFRLGAYNRHGVFNEVQTCWLQNEPRRGAKVLEELGLTPITDKDLLAKDVGAASNMKELIRPFDEANRPLFILNPGAKFAAKCWPAEYFSVIVRALSRKYNAVVGVTGTLDEKELTASVCTGADGCEVLDLAGRTDLSELVALLRLAKGCITNDTGTMHLAAAVGIPTVGIFATLISPAHWFPLGPKVAAIFHPSECSCYQIEQCPDSRCLRSIQPRDIWTALQRLLGEPSPGEDWGCYSTESSCLHRNGLARLAE